jgi:hypothetical protein
MSNLGFFKGNGKGSYQQKKEINNWGAPKLRGQ